METIIKYLVIWLPGLTPAALFFIALLFYPEKIEKWSALLWKLLNSFGGIFRTAHKRYVKHDLQGRVNEFVKYTSKNVPGLSEEKLQIQWVDPDMKRDSFIDKGKVVLRLRREDPDDQNFVHGAFLFISTSLLHKPKRYLSKTQREALDLFVCTKLLEREKESVVGIFIDQYLHPKTEDTKSKIAIYIDDCATIDNGGFFFTIFLQELGYLGGKVFGKRRDDLIYKEVTNLVNFLKPIANRKIGDAGDLNFNGEYCRFGIVICGKPSKMIVSIEPYVNYIRSNLADKEADTIYLLARVENSNRVNQICEEFSEEYKNVRKFKFVRRLKYPDRTEKASQYLAILRRRGIEVIQTSMKE